MKAIWGSLSVVVLLLVPSFTAGRQEARNVRKGDSAEDIFKERILPIFRSPKPSSCTECHLGGVDLKDYLTSDPRKSFAYLRDADLIDKDKPENSQILKLISMKPETPSMISEKARKREFEAFKAWIIACVEDKEMMATRKGRKKLGPKVPDEIIRHSRKDRLLASFIDNVWSERQRCWNCHGPGDPPNPKQQRKKQDWIKKYGKENVLWFKSEDPAEAMESILQSRIVDFRNPSKSLLLTKPTVKVKHEGGKKINVGDRAYRQFSRFLLDYIKIRAGKYKKKRDLPGRIRTAHWLRVRGVPVNRFVLMQVDFHRRERGRWSKRPFARAFGESNKGNWNGPVELLVPRTDKKFEELSEKAVLPEGRYQLRFYVDRRNKIQRNPAYQFSTCRDTLDGARVDSRGCAMDADRDLVPDGLDACADTPAGWTVGPDGCPLDTDGDGVADSIDACEATPRKAVVDETGCPLDGDGDGVFDGFDQCPDTLGGIEVDERGCFCTWHASSEACDISTGIGGRARR